MKLMTFNKRMFIILIPIVIVLCSVIFVSSCQKGESIGDAEITLKPVPLNLSDITQQTDFKKYLISTTAILTNEIHRRFFTGFNLAALTENDKKTIATRMLKSPEFMKTFSEYHAQVKTMERKYEVSKFTKEQWFEIAKYGMSQGIYFLPSLKEKVKNMELLSLEASRQNTRGNSIVEVECCPCSDLVENANQQLANEVLTVSAICIGLYGNPIAAAVCWASLGAWYLYQNNVINSVEYWCDCMIENYGVCVY